MSELYSSVKNGVLRDSKWVRNSFLLASRNSSASDEEFWRLQTTADQKFTNSRLGGNYSINNPPQFTRYADIRYSGLATGIKEVSAGMVRGEELGMGRGYSEHIDDRSQLIHIQFGVPDYNGMVTFFTSFFDGDASLLASEGRGSFSYYAGRVAGAVLGVAIAVAFPWLAILVAGASAATNVLRFFLNNPASKYYYLRPTMELYWNRVNLITNQIAVNMGLVSRVFNGDDPVVKDQSNAFSADYTAYMHEIAPDIFREGGGIDVYAISNKAQRMADERMRRMIEISNRENLSNEQRAAQMKEFLKTRVAKPEDISLDVALKEYHESPVGNVANRRSDPAGSRLTADVDVSMLKAENTEAKNADVEAVSKQSEGVTPGTRPKWKYSTDEQGKQTQVKEKSYLDEFVDAYKANRRDGQQFVAYRVDYTGTASESFSNSTKESDISSKINGFSSSSRSARFSFSEGNTGIGIIDSVKSSIASFISGGLDSLHMSGLLSLAGSAFVDIPKHYDSSSATFTTTSYTIELRSPYGNKISRFINLYVPLATLLAAALPLSTGKQSYTAPFLCRLYSRGKAQIQLGMISSLSITRGTGNLGWNEQGECLGIDVSFEVTNMSSVLHAPIEAGSILPWKNILDEDSAFTDYMAVLGNLSMADQYYQTNKLALNLTKKREMYKTMFTPAAVANSLDVPWPTRYLGYLLGVAARGAEGLN